MPTVLAFRDKLLPRSETFVLRHYRTDSRWTPAFAGAARAADGLPLDPWPSFALSDVGGPLPAQAYRWTGRHAALERFARGQGARIVHAHFGKSGAIALPLARRLGLPLVVSFHGGDATKRGHFRRWPKGGVFARRLAALKAETALFLTDSEYLRTRLIERGFPGDRIQAHHIGVDASDYAFTPLAGRKRDVLFVGRFVEKKGLPDLFTAMRRLWADGSDLTLTLIGDGPLRAIVERETAQGGPINWLGWRDQAGVRAALAQARIAVAPSRQAANGDCEGLPSVIYEAAAIGAPLIATAHSGAPEAIVDGVSGRLTPEGDPAALADAIAAVAADDALAARFSAAARRDAETRLNAKTSAAALDAAFDAVAASA